MSASSRILDALRRDRRPMRLVGASGQLGYGVPTPAFDAALARQPDLIGADMGSIDIGPTYLGKGEMATSPAATRRDLRKLLHGARGLNIPLVIGSAGSAGAAPHLDATLAIVREIARTDGLHFRLGVLRADLSRPMLAQAVRDGRVRGIDDMPALTEEDVAEAAQIVGQMGMGPFRRALAEDVDVIIAGRACDTAIFAALPTMLGFPTGLAVHMAKIIECASLCCVPGGRDSILAELDDDGFVLESMNPQRRATPTSVAAHSLYEQADPFTVYEPEGKLDLAAAQYVAVDDRRTRVTGARWEASTDPCVKIEGRLQDRRARGAAGRRRRSALHRAASGNPGRRVGRGARPGLRRHAAGLHAAVPRLWRGRCAHGRAGTRTAARRGVRHGRMHRTDRRACVGSGAHLQAIPAAPRLSGPACPPPATSHSRSHRPKFR